MFQKPEIIGLDKTLAHLDRIGEIPAAMGETMKEAVLYVHSQVPGYPEPFSAFSTYVRTGLLGRSVTTMQGAGVPEALSRVEPSPLGGNVVGMIGTRVKYAPLVIGEGTQANIHKDWWWTLQGVVKGAWSGIVDIFRKMVHDKVEK